MSTSNMTTRNPSRLGKHIKDLSQREDSPCFECLVVATCTKSFVTKSACYAFAEYVQNMLDKKGRYLDEDKG